MIVGGQREHVHTCCGVLPLSAHIPIGVRVNVVYYRVFIAIGFVVKYL